MRREGRSTREQLHHRQDEGGTDATLRSETREVTHGDNDVKTRRNETNLEVFELGVLLEVAPAVTLLTKHDP